MEFSRRKLLINLCPFIYAAVIVWLDRIWSVSEKNADLAKELLACGLLVMVFRWLFSYLSSNASENSTFLVGGGLWGTLQGREIPPVAFYILGLVLLMLGTFPLIDQVVVTTFHIAAPYSHVPQSN